MTIDYSSLLYDPVYEALGVPAVMFAGEEMSEVALTVIDDTHPKTNTSGVLQVRSVEPGAFARIPELAENGIERADYVDAMLSFSGRTWLVRNYDIIGSPNGEDVGEVRFLLKASTADRASITSAALLLSGHTIDAVGSMTITEAILSLLGSSIAEIERVGIVTATLTFTGSNIGELTSAFFVTQQDGQFVTLDNGTQVALDTPGEDTMAPSVPTDLMAAPFL